MNDRELLELAALAFGYRVYITEAGECRILGDGDDGGRRYMCTWSPLEDDGDALRLAVKLGMLDESKKAHFTLMWHLSGYGEEDDYATIRRAIVCAAAEIGKAMQEGATAGEKA
jgi:hypothetical protein